MGLLNDWLTYLDAQVGHGVYLRGRDFVKGDFLPIASYWIDTAH